MLCKIRRICLALQSCPGVRVRNGVIYFDGSMRIAIITRWQVEFLFGGPKQLRQFQYTVHDVRVLCPWIKRYDINPKKKILQNKISTRTTPNPSRPILQPHHRSSPSPQLDVVPNVLACDT